MSKPLSVVLKVAEHDVDTGNIVFIVVVLDVQAVQLAHAQVYDSPLGLDLGIRHGQRWKRCLFLANTHDVLVPDIVVTDETGRYLME